MTAPGLHLHSIRLASIVDSHFSGTSLYIGTSIGGCNGSTIGTSMHVTLLSTNNGALHAFAATINGLTTKGRVYLPTGTDVHSPRL